MRDKFMRNIFMKNANFEIINLINYKTINQMSGVLGFWGFGVLGGYKELARPNLLPLIS